MSAHNICFHGEIKKKYLTYPLLSNATVLFHYFSMESGSDLNPPSMR